MVWKVILLLDRKDSKYGKLTPNWEGLYVIHQVLRSDAYHLKNLDGEVDARSINGEFLT